MLKIFIGTSEHQDTAAERVLVYSLHKNTNEELDIIFLRPSMFPDWDRSTWGTPFSYFRYAIPELCNWKGKAIYMDVDQLNFRNIADLWNTDLEGKPFGMCWEADNWNGGKHRGTPLERGWYSDSVMVIDCEKAKEWVDEIHHIRDINNVGDTYKYVFFAKCGAPYKEKATMIHEIDARWNSFDGTNTSIAGANTHYDIHDIWHVHFTGLSYQPWHPNYIYSLKGTHERSDITDVWWKYHKIINEI